MDRSGEKEDEAEVVTVGVSRSPAASNAIACPSQPRPTRGCVQKKLVFGESRGAGKDEREEEDYEESEDEGKGKRKRKGKGKAKAAAPRKVPSRGKEVLESSQRASEFFTKVSEKRLQHKQDKEQKESAALNIGSNDCSKASESTNGKKCRQQPKMHDGDSTPCKDQTPMVSKRCRQQLKGQDGYLTSCKDQTPKVSKSQKDSKSPCSEQKRSSSKSTAARVSGTQTLDKDQPTLNLWLEAKSAAEENQRLSAGRQIHPFFSSFRVARKSTETSEIDKVKNQCYLDFSGCSPPIHVFDKLEDATSSLDWSNWNINEKSLFCLNGSAPEISSLPIFECSLEPLRFDNVSCTPKVVEKLSLDKQIEMNQLLGKTSMISEKVNMSSLPSSTQEAQEQLISYLRRVHENNDLHLPTKCNSSNGSWATMKDTERRERLECYKLHRGYHSDHTLWTNKYQPEKALEVCGNSNAVKVISEWLQSWHERGLQSSRTNVLDKKAMISDSDGSSFSSDSDMETEDDETQAQNVLLVTGPVGSGKSAAIYACAKEQGFEVIEVNASDQRNGALVKQKFGEATESHGLDICLVKDHVGLEATFTSKFGTAHNDKKVHVSKDSDLEVISWTCQQDLTVHESRGKTIDDKVAICQAANKSLILFEDVDIVFEEDRGFVSTIMQLAETTRRPIILTTNSKDPVLPRILLRQVVDFVHPLLEELLSLVSMICATEEAFISPILLKRLIKSCHSDIRKTILHLQFWCQGKGMNKHSLYGPLQFDIDAAHQMVPGIVPWGFPCKLSEIVEEEVTQTDILMKERSFNVDAVKQEEWKFNENDNSKDGKDAGIKMWPIIKCKESLSPFKDQENSNTSSSPVKFTRRTVLHRNSTVLSSESEDERACDLPSVDVEPGFPSSCPSPDVSLVSLSQSLKCHGNLDLSLGFMDKSGSHELFQSPQWTSGGASFPNTLDMNISVDTSCIPESDFVPETVINHGHDFMPGALSSVPVSIAPDEDLVSSIKSIFNCSETRDDKVIHEFNPHLHIKFDDTCDFDTESVNGNEELQDLETECPDFVNAGSQFVDECSRVDFTIGHIPEKNNFLEMPESMQETWKRLRSRREDFKSYLTDDQKTASQTLKIVSGMTDLIADIDIMLSGCEIITNDLLEPTMVPCVEPYSASWYDEQLAMVSTFAQHGLCSYAKNSLTVGPILGSERTVNLAEEMLASTTNLMALGKQLLRENTDKGSLHGERGERIGELSYATNFTREEELNLSNAILPIIPERACMSLKGHAFHEYMSFLSLIAKSENSRLSQRIDGERHQRRVRASRHYLESCPLPLSPEDVTLLAHHCCFGVAGFG